MGVLKTLFFITAPIVGLTVFAFRLGKQLPVASRLFGNYIGLSYVYFKSILKFIKPVDQMPFEMISLARKTSQQSQALRRQLKETLKRAKEDINAKKKETFDRFGQQIKDPEMQAAFSSYDEPVAEVERGKPFNQLSGSHLIYQIMQNRNELLLLKQQKKKSRKFYENL